MPNVRLEEQEWQQVLQIIAQAPWHAANPLLMKIGEQLKRQSLGNSGETTAAQAEVSGKH